MNTHVCSHVVLIKTLKRVTLGVGKYEHTCLFTCDNDQDFKEGYSRCREIGIHAKS